MILRDTEHYYYVIYHHDKWEICKANNQRQMRRHGYDTSNIVLRVRHYDQASAWLHAVHHPDRIRYVSLTGIDLVD